MAARSYRTAYSEKRRVNSDRSDKERLYSRKAYTGRTYSAAGGRGRYYYRTEVTWEEGNTVRKLVPEEEILPEEPAGRPERRVSERTRRNRARARSMSAAYVLFLSALCICSVFFCLHYLQLRSELTTQNETIASMESELSQLRADNDAYYKAAQASLSMDDVKETAEKNGLDYATQSQIRYYNADDESYVRQYADVPDK